MSTPQRLPSSRALPGAIVHPARDSDLRAAAEIYAVNEMAMRRRMHPLTGVANSDEAAQTRGALEDLRALHAEDPRHVWVAEIAGNVAGIAAAVFRECHAHIQYLFVAPNAQERGAGEALLDRLQEAGTAAGCTVWTLQASDDPRALTRYLRLGLRPQPPNVVWRADEPSFPRPGLDNPYEAIPLGIDDDAALNTVGDIDKAVRGVRRRPDIERWLRAGATGALLLDRGSGKPAGYFLIAVGEREGRIGPVAAMDDSEFGAVLGNALAAAGLRHEPGTTWKLAVPGENHAAIEPLLTARFRPSYAMTFFASRPIGRFDRYLFHDLDLL